MCGGLFGGGGGGISQLQQSALLLATAAAQSAAASAAGAAGAPRADSVLANPRSRGRIGIGGGARPGALNSLTLDRTQPSGDGGAGAAGGLGVGG